MPRDAISLRRLAPVAIAIAIPALAGGVIIDGGNIAYGPFAGDARLALGKQVYAQHCASCHGARLEGQANWQSRKPDGRMPAPPHDALGHTWHHTDEQLFTIVKHGVEAIAPPGYRSDMPAYQDVLSDDEIRVVLGFIESTWPEPIRKRRRAMAKRTR